MNLVIQIDTPVKTMKRYAADTGIPLGTVKKMVQRGELQIMPKYSPKSSVLINMIPIYAAAGASAYVPATVPTMVPTRVPTKA
ncbi:hypothetical protein Q7I25_08860 [Aeromonas hydrophila]|uniref:hypothetical protein n=1 Tax=Aeromonas TaxID=642 RepID=UPI003007891A